MAINDSLVASFSTKYLYNFWRPENAIRFLGDYGNSTFNQICDDVDDTRVYGGIHFRFDQVVGSRLGREMATYVYKHNLRKANGKE